MNIDIFIPARLNSARLPAKHLKKINGQPIIKHLVTRLQSAKKIRNIIVCTTELSSDNPLVEFLEKEKIFYFRGNDEDILVRLLDAAKHFETDIIVDVEGDDIYTDPFYVDAIVEEMENSDLDFVSGNTSTQNFGFQQGFPHGLIPAGIKRSALEKICILKQTNKTETGYKEFFTRSKLFKCKYLFPDPNLTFDENLRLTLDYPEDFNLATEIFNELGVNFHFQDILKLFNKKPNLLKITEPVIERWQQNYEKSTCDFSLKQ